MDATPPGIHASTENLLLKYNTARVVATQLLRAAAATAFIPGVSSSFPNQALHWKCGSLHSFGRKALLPSLELPDEVHPTTSCANRRGKMSADPMLDFEVTARRPRSGGKKPSFRQAIDLGVQRSYRYVRCTRDIHMGWYCTRRRQQLPSVIKGCLRIF